MRATPITGTGLSCLAGKRALRSVNLSETLIGDAAIERLRDLQGLRRLELHQTQITDAALPLLAGFAELELLDLEDWRD